MIFAGLPFTPFSPHIPDQGFGFGFGFSADPVFAASVSA